MSEWKTVRLGDVCEIQSGGTPSRSKTEYWKNGTIPWVKIGDFSGKYLNKTTEHITQKGLENSSAKLFSKGTILYSIFATLGEATILNIDATTNQAIAGIKIKDKSSIDIDYLFAYLKSLKEEVNRIGRGVAQNNINLSILKAFTFPLPPLETQKQIAKQLNKCTTLLAKHKQMLEKYDTLIKSRFIEMFGEPATNPNKWEIKTLDEVCKKITDGKHGGCKLEDNSDYYYVGAREIFDLNIHYETAQEITKEDFEKDYKRCNLEIGDFCIVNTGATIGKTAIAKDVRTTKTLLQKSVALLKTKENLLSALYLQYSYITNPSMYKVENASAQPNLLLSKIRETKIMLPPLSLQNSFAAFVQQIDKSKFAVQKSLEKAETLYKSLMQEYFG